jgi:hypothetical protein
MSLPERMAAHRLIASRQWLFDDCRAVKAERTNATTEQDHIAVAEKAAELEIRCQRYGFASSVAFLKTLRDEGWLSPEIATE